MSLTKTQSDDLTFIKRPGYWPKWPSLPMNNAKLDQTGFLLDRQPIDQKIDPKHVSLRTVYLMNPWEFFTATGKNKKKLEDVSTKVYESIEAMLLDGWNVD